MTMDKQRERLGSVEKITPRDNIDLDVIDALAMGYGCQYGRYKADHPLTKDANEARLAEIQKAKKKRPATKSSRPIVRNYTLVCKCCGNKFASPNNSRSYCSALCKGRKKKQNRIDKKEVIV